MIKFAASFTRWFGILALVCLGTRALAQAPTITSVVPMTGPEKRNVTINGTNFAGGAITSRTVRLNGQVMTSISSSATRLIFTVPAGATSGPISVQTNLGSTTAPGDFIVAPGAPPANDLFAAAQPLAGASGFFVGNTANATKEPGEPAHAADAGGASVWFTWTAPSSGPFLFNPHDPTATNFGVSLAIYAGTSLGDLAQVANAASGIPSSRFQSAAVLNATAGVTYFIALDGFTGIMGDYRLAWSALAAPTVASFTPASAYAGQQVNLGGTGFVAGMAVTVGGVAVSPSRVNVTSPTQAAITQLPSAVLAGPAAIGVTTAAGSATSAASLMVLPAPPPSIASFSPQTGGVGTLVTFTGTALWLGDTPSSISFNGVLANQITVTNGSTIAARVPSGATTGPITVTTLAGAASTATNFQVTSSFIPPVISGFSPVNAAPGALVNVFGQNFAGATAVSLNGLAVPFTVDPFGQLISFTVPAGASSGPITVANPAGSATSATAFIVSGPPPVITGFSPSLISPGTSVMITGSNFVGVQQVSFNGFAANSFTIDSPTRITAVVPFAPISDGPIVVTSGDGVAVSPTPFTFIAPSGPPTITGFSPGIISDGTSVAISGTNFAGAHSVAFNGVPASSFTVDSPTQITAVVPPGPISNGPVMIFGPLGSGFSATPFIYVPPGPPTITSFSPTAIGPGASVEITGTGFVDVSAVQFNGVGASFTVSSPTRIIATAPASLIPGPITVTAATGTGTSVTNYTVSLVPTITGFTPSGGPEKRVVTVFGANFSGTNIPSATVRVNGVPATPISRSSTAISFVVPPGATTGPLTVQTSHGLATSPAHFIVAAGPSPANDHFAHAQPLSGVTGLISGNTANATKEPGEPNHAGNAGGASIWFTWTAPQSGFFLFDPATGTGPLTQFGIIQTIYTGDALSALTPVASGLTPTSIFARYGSAAVLNAVAGTTYRIALDGVDGVMADYDLSWGPIGPPTITSVSPSSATAGQTITISINGTNFAPGGTVSFDGALVDPARIIYQRPNLITVSQVPLAAVTGPITVTTPVGAASSPNPFVVTSAPAPVVTSFTPGGAKAGTPITISGSNFTGTTAVLFNGTPASSFAVNAAGTSIATSVPVGASSGPLTVVRPGGSGVSALPFTVIVLPVITEHPQSQTATIGQSVTFRVVVQSNGPEEYFWRKNGVAIFGADTATLTLPAVALADAGTYECVVGNNAGFVTSQPATLTVNKIPATLALGGLSATYDGTPKAATATTTPTGLNVHFTYDGSATPPTNAGSYAVIASIGDATYVGSVSGTLTIAPQSVPIALAGLVQPYNGEPRPVSATTAPAGLSLAITYDGSPTPPTNPGHYQVVATVNDANHTGTISATLAVTITALVQHAPVLNGAVDGSIQMLQGESLMLNGQASLSGDLLVPGTPTLRLNGNPTFAGVRDATGAAMPDNYQITLNGHALLRYLVRRVDPIALPSVAVPPAPTGTRDLVVNSSTASLDFAAVRHLTLNSNAGAVALPPGTYGDLTVNGQSSITLGVAGGTEPAVYNFQRLTLNGSAQLRVIGPVIVNLAHGTPIQGAIGDAAQPGWLTLAIASGGLTLNGNAQLHGHVIAPTGAVVINGNSVLHGSSASAWLTINGNGLLAQPE